MDKDFQNIFNKAKQVKLSSVEKEEMRTVLGLFADIHPVRNISATRLLLWERSKFHISTFQELLTLKTLIKLQPMAIILIIALFIGGGTSFASEGALPGDLLYPVKININEEIGSFVAFSNEAQAKWDARRAERRLEEAEKLATEGRLNAETRADIESRFESHAEAFQKRAEKIESKQNANGSFEVNSNFEASLKAHEQVLAHIAREKSDVRDEVETLLLGIHARLNTTAQARNDAEIKISAKVGVESKTAAEGKLKAAENKINEVRGFVVRMKSSVSVSASAQAELQLKAAEDVVVRGKAEMEAEAYGKAFASFQEAIRIAQEAKLLVATEDRIKLEINAHGIDIGTEGEIKEDQSGGDSSGTSVEVESEAKVESESGSIKAGGSGKLKIDIGL